MIWVLFAKPLATTEKPVNKLNECQSSLFYS